MERRNKYVMNTSICQKVMSIQTSLLGGCTASSLSLRTKDTQIYADNAASSYIIWISLPLPTNCGAVAFLKATSSFGSLNSLIDVQYMLFWEISGAKYRLQPSSQLKFDSLRVVACIYL